MISTRVKRGDQRRDTNLKQERALFPTSDEVPIFRRANQFSIFRSNETPNVPSGEEDLSEWCAQAYDTGCFGVDSISFSISNYPHIVCGHGSALGTRDEGRKVRVGRGGKLRRRGAKKEK